MNLAMGCLLATIVFILAPFIADFYDKSVLTNLIRVMSVCFIINASNLTPKTQLPARFTSSIDNALMERSKRIKVLSAKFA